MNFIQTHPRALPAALMAGLLAISAFAGAMSIAYFGDSETDDATFTAGTIALDATKVDALTLTSSNMMPGDSITDDVTIENDGSSELRYAVSTSSTNADTKDVRSIVTLAIKTADTGAGNTFAEDADSCDDGTGTELRAATALGASSNVIGDPTQGSQTGDRTLASAGNEVLCFTVALPTTAGDTYQAASTTTTFTFTAEQTANNS